MRDMQIVPIHIIDVSDELDDKVYAFEFLDVINKPAPLHKQWYAAIRCHA